MTKAFASATEETMSTEKTFRHRAGREIVRWLFGLGLSPAFDEYGEPDDELLSGIEAGLLDPSCPARDEAASLACVLIRVILSGDVDEGLLTRFSAAVSDGGAS